MTDRSWLRERPNLGWRTYGAQGGRREKDYRNSFVYFGMLLVQIVEATGPLVFGYLVSSKTKQTRSSPSQLILRSKN